MIDHVINMRERERKRVCVCVCVCVRVRICIYARLCVYVCINVFRGLLWIKTPNIWYIYDFSRDVVFPVFNQLAFILLIFLTVQNSCHYPPLSQYIPNTMSMKYSSLTFYLTLLVYISVTFSKWENSLGFKVWILNLTWILFKCLVSTVSKPIQSSLKIQPLTLCRTIFWLCCGYHCNKNVSCGQIAGFLNVKPSGTDSNHRALED